MKNCILITGATDGIGKQTALELAGFGLDVIVHGRSEIKCRNTVDEIISLSGNKNVFSAVCDLSSLKNIPPFAQQIRNNFPGLNILINNAGVYMNDYRITDDGYEMTFAVNHLSVFALTLLLLPTLKENAPSRIITVSSVAHSRGKIDFDDFNLTNGFNGYTAYSQSKLANVLFTFALAKRIEKYGITANCLHPGVITTKLLKEGFGMSGDSLTTGAATSVYLATSEEGGKVTGKYFAKSKITESSPLSRNEEIAEQLWKLSENLTGSTFPATL